jgi:hypothetical protein
MRSGSPYGLRTTTLGCVFKNEAPGLRDLLLNGGARLLSKTIRRQLDRLSKIHALWDEPLTRVVPRG